MPKRIRTHANPLSFNTQLEPCDFSTIFPSFSEDLELEIGFGKGVFLTSYGQKYPNRHILAAEVRKGLFDHLTSVLDEKKISNVHLIHSTGERCLIDLIPDKSLTRVFFFIQIHG